MTHQTLSLGKYWKLFPITLIKIVILVLVSSCYCFWVRGIVSVVFVFSKLFMLDLARAADRPKISSSRYHLKLELKYLANDIEEHCKKKLKHSSLLPKRAL